ncbi:MAG: transcription antitermination factor NusB [Phycisphaerales bacterium]
MALPRDIRRLAFQALFQIDARGGEDPSLAESLGDTEGLTPADLRKAADLARAAWGARAAADAEMNALAPTWPAGRQAAVDRSILRLAHFEMASGRAHPKIVVNEAVELAKAFGSDRSPAFVNGLLDKVLKRVLAERPAGPAPADAPPADSAPAEPAPGVDA